MKNSKNKVSKRSNLLPCSKHLRLEIISQNFVPLKMAILMSQTLFHLKFSHTSRPILSSINRRELVIISRLRICYFVFTDGHLLARQSPSLFSSCQNPLNTPHIVPCSLYFFFQSTQFIYIHPH